MAQYLTAVYQDENVARRVIYDLVDQGVGRHSVALVFGDTVEMKDGSIDRAAIEAEADDHRAALDKGQALLVVWVIEVPGIFVGRGAKLWVEGADKIMNSYKPLLFEMKKAEPA